jgi:hypothetical protein
MEMLRCKVCENRGKNRGGHPVLLRVAAMKIINTFTLTTINMTIFSLFLGKKPDFARF